MGGRIKTFFGVPQIPVLARNLISIIKMSDVDVKRILKRILVGRFEEQ